MRRIRGISIVIQPAYYHAAVRSFVHQSVDEILGQLTSNHLFALEGTQRDAWRVQVLILQRELAALDRGSHALAILPILIATRAPACGELLPSWAQDQVADPVLSNGGGLVMFESTYDSAGCRILGTCARERRVDHLLTTPLCNDAKCTGTQDADRGPYHVPLPMPC